MIFIQNISLIWTRTYPNKPYIEIMIKKIFGSTQSMLIYIISCLVVIIVGYYRGVGWSAFEIISVPFLGLMIWGAIMVVLGKL